jgi:hypothetical protein
MTSQQFDYTRLVKRNLDGFLALAENSSDTQKHFKITAYNKAISNLAEIESIHGAIHSIDPLMVFVGGYPCRAFAGCSIMNKLELVFNTKRDHPEVEEYFNSLGAESYDTIEDDDTIEDKDDDYIPEDEDEDEDLPIDTYQHSITNYAIECTIENVQHYVDSLNITDKKMLLEELKALKNKYKVKA